VFSQGHWAKGHRARARREGYRAVLEYRRDVALEQLEKLNDDVFHRDGWPTRAELDQMSAIRTRIDGYQELLTRFFMPLVAPYEDEFRELLY